MTYDSLLAENTTLKARNLELSAALAERGDRLSLALQQVEYLKRMLFARRSGRFECPGHPELFDFSQPDAPDVPGAEEQPAAAEPAAKRGPRKTRAARIPENLPEEVETVVPDCVISCPEKWEEAGCEETRTLELQPGRLFIRVVRRLKFVPKEEPSAPPVIEPAKPRMIENGFWGPSLLAEILANRFCHHLPYHRQAAMFKSRYGVDLPVSTMSDAADKAASQCAVLLAEMKKDVLASGVVCADETPVRYLDRNHPDGSSPGWLWVWSDLYGDVIFAWRTHRRHCNPAEWLGEEFEGVLLSDGCEAYENYVKQQAAAGRSVRRAACMAHIRRKFKEALAERPAIVQWILKIIGMLYALERDWKEWGAGPEARRRVRRRHSLPLMNLLKKAFIRLQSRGIPPKSRLGRALSYALGQWGAMETYPDDGRVPIDNNATGRSIRPSAVGKKNWLFVGHPEAGARAATLYSLLVSAKNHGADPQEYLRDVIERLPGMPLNRIRELLPGNWARARREAETATSAA